jgi:hypothetical protein
MKDSTIEITILNKGNIVKYIPLLRKLTKKPMNEIKENILNEKPIIICKYTKKPEEFRLAYQSLKDLMAIGAQVKIIQNIFDEMTREIDTEIIENLIQSEKEITKQIEMIKDLELEED